MLNLIVMMVKLKTNQQSIQKMLIFLPNTQLNKMRKNVIIETLLHIGGNHLHLAEHHKFRCNKQKLAYNDSRKHNIHACKVQIDNPTLEFYSKSWFDQNGCNPINYSECNVKGCGILESCLTLSLISSYINKHPYLQ